jgi:glutathione gamma-glutamylcysteinyltransferase
VLVVVISVTKFEKRVNHNKNRMAAMAGLYRRLLPSPPSVDFASSHGKQLFLEGIQNGTMEGFYRLVSYFQTQSEPAFCGLASLSMVLNALAIDPGRKWKGTSPSLNKN